MSYQEINSKNQNLTTIIQKIKNILAASQKISELSKSDLYNLILLVSKLKLQISQISLYQKNEQINPKKFEEFQEILENAALNVEFATNDLNNIIR